MAHAHGLRGQPLPPMQNGLDAGGHRGRGNYRLPARPGAGARGYDALRPVRGATNAGLATDHRADFAEAAQAFNRLQGVVRGFYRAKIDTLRRSLPGRDLAAAVRAVIDDERAALRALAASRIASRAALDVRQATERLAKQNLVAMKAPPAQILSRR